MIIYALIKAPICLFTNINGKFNPIKLKFLILIFTQTHNNKNLRHKKLNNNMLSR